MKGKEGPASSAGGPPVRPALPGLGASGSWVMAQLRCVSLSKRHDLVEPRSSTLEWGAVVLPGTSGRGSRCALWRPQACSRPVTTHTGSPASRAPHRTAGWKDVGDIEQFISRAHPEGPTGHGGNEPFPLPLRGPHGTCASIPEHQEAVPPRRIRAAAGVELNSSLGHSESIR